jgi:hypothetical protein
MDRFFELAAQMDHDVDALRAGEELETTCVAADVDKLRELLAGDEAPDARVARTERLKRRAPELLDASVVTEAALLRRVEAYIYGDEPLSDADRSRIAAAFPVHLRAISAVDKTLAPGEVWNLGSSAPPVVVNLGKLTMQPGSSIVVHNTVLALNVETLVRNGAVGAGGANYDLAVLGATGATPTPGKPGESGGVGSPGIQGDCSGPGVAGNSGGPGKAGATGARGGVGKPGEAGRPALTATISIKPGGITGSSPRFVILTRSGTGGAGAVGGTGGAGGVGGTGGHGASCGCEGTNGGNGGTGGRGGTGGTGGTGGNGTDGDEITVTVPVGQAKLIIGSREEAPAGNGGEGGAGGSGGKGGAGGGGGKHHDGGSSGGSRSGAPAGQPGKAGTLSGAPGQITVNESG